MEKDYKKLCEEYEKKLGLGVFDPAKEGYLVLVNILQQQNEYLKVFQIKTMITSDDTAKKEEYKNAKALWEGLSKMIESVNSLKYSLKIDEEKKAATEAPISPQSIGFNGRKNNV